MKEKIETLKIIITLLAIGILGGLIVSAGLNCWRIIASVFSSYNAGIFFEMQVVSFSILSLITIGVVSARIVKSGKTVDTDALMRGLFTGLFTGITIFLSSFPNNPGPREFLLLLLSISAALLFCGIGAYIQNSCDNRQIISSLSTPKIPARFCGGVSPFTVLIVLIGFTIIVIPVIAYAGIWAGVIGQYPGGRYCSDNPVMMIRTGNDSFEINQEYKCERNITDMNKEHPYRHWFPRGDDPKPPYKVNYEIFVDGKEVTNMSIIQMQGLRDTIEPKEGLNDPQFHRTFLKGPDFSLNTTDPRDIEVYLISGEKRYPLITIY